MTPPLVFTPHPPFLPPHPGVYMSKYSLERSKFIDAHEDRKHELKELCALMAKLSIEANILEDAVEEDEPRYLAYLNEIEEEERREDERER